MTAFSANILIVEYEPDIRFLLETILNQEDFTVLAVDTIPLAKEIIVNQGKGVSLIVMNILYGGLELLESIKVAPASWSVLYTTARLDALKPDSEIRQRIARIKAPKNYDILPMPFGRDELLTRVNQLLGR